MSARWLIVGHGSVGSTLAKRILAAGGVVSVYDATPRLEIPAAPGLLQVAVDTPVDPDFVAMCVPAGAAEAAGEYLRANVKGSPTIFDWTSALPVAKRGISDLGPGSWIDIALLDSLDRPAGRPLLAASGAAIASGAKSLERIGFEVLAVGEEVGQAAAVKLARSLFMKSLEAIVIESRAIGLALDPVGAAWMSVERSLGTDFSAFADVLVTSNATHSARRSAEIRQVNSFASDYGYSPVMGAAAARVLQALASRSARRPSGTDRSVNDLLIDAQLAFRPSEDA